MIPPEVSRALAHEAQLVADPWANADITPDLLRGARADVRVTWRRDPEAREQLLCDALASAVASWRLNLRSLADTPAGRVHEVVALRRLALTLLVELQLARIGYDEPDERGILIWTLVEAAMRRGPSALVQGDAEALRAHMAKRSKRVARDERRTFDSARRNAVTIDDERSYQLEDASATSDPFITEIADQIGAHTVEAELLALVEEQKVVAESKRSAGLPVPHAVKMRLVALPIAAELLAECRSGVRDWSKGKRALRQEFRRRVIECVNGRDGPPRLTDRDSKNLNNALSRRDENGDAQGVLAQLSTQALAYLHLLTIKDLDNHEEGAN
jgi:hypothetical protein